MTDLIFACMIYVSCILEKKMKKFLVLFLLALSVISCASNVVIEGMKSQELSDPRTYLPMVSMEELKAAPRSLIPFPQNVKWGRGETIVEKSKITKALTQLDFSTSLEAYSLTVSASTISIEANDEKGFFYAMQTLNQLTENGSKPAPVCQIKDFPAYEIRGVMHDTGRNFQSIDYLKDQMKRLSAYKINTFHWHITDNPGYRIESKKYPILNDPKTMYKTRKPGLFYTFDEVRDLIQYCNALNINVIVEIDMPGHSKYFPKAFGTSMHSAKGQRICADLLQEFCDEIPVELAPIVHIGTDEIHIPRPEAFAQRMTDILRKNGREGAVWAPGIESSPDIMRQVWAWETFQAGYRNIDSSDFYASSMDYFNSIARVFFKQVCGVEKGSDESLGGIICTWNDVQILDEKNILRNNPFYLTALAGAEVMWQGNPTGDLVNIHLIPEKGTLEWDHFDEFEDRVIYHKDLYFDDVDDEFIYAKQSDIEWTVVDESGNEKSARGISVLLNNFLSETGLFPAVEVGDSVTATRKIYSETDKTVWVRAGFDVQARPHRFYGGVPPKGKWDRYGSDIFVNGERLNPPTWKQPGKYRHDIYQTWDHPVQETAWTAEEIYWRRDAVPMQLKAGENIIEIKAVRGYSKQIYMFGFWILEE